MKSVFAAVLCLLLGLPSATFAITVTTDAGGEPEDQRHPPERLRRKHHVNPRPDRSRRG